MRSDQHERNTRGKKKTCQAPTAGSNIKYRSMRNLKRTIVEIDWNVEETCSESHVFLRFDLFAMFSLCLVDR